MPIFDVTESCCLSRVYKKNDWLTCKELKLLQLVELNNQPNKKV